MLRAIWALCLVAACTTDDPNPQAIGPSKHAGVPMTSAIRTCRETCWRDIPYDECARQRDSCYGETTKAEPPTLAARHCREVAHTCRRLRRDCLQGCWSNVRTPIADPALDGT